MIYIPSPLAHQTGFLYGMWIALRLGAPQVLQESWDPRSRFDAIERTGVTFVQAATPFLADLVRVAARARSRRAAPAADVRRRPAPRSRVSSPGALAVVLGAEVGGAFGTTESCLGAGVRHRATRLNARGAPTARALAGVSLRIVDDERPRAARRVPRATSRCCTATLFAGYLNRPELTAEAVDRRRLVSHRRPGAIDADGYLRITGRVKDVINRGGEKVPVAEIEQLLYEHPAVARGRDRGDARRASWRARLRVRGARRRMAISTSRRCSEYLDSERVAKPYWPERLELVESLPRTPSGKIQKFVLREQARRFTAVHRKAMPNDHRRRHRPDRSTTPSSPR